MKKVLMLISLLIISLMFLGCGQDLNVTMYNTSGITNYADQYIGCTISWDEGSESNSFASSTIGFDDLDSTNSYTFKAKENSSISAYAFGQYYVEDSSGNTSLSELSIPVSTATLYGGFPDAKDWYVAIYANEIIIFNR